MRFPLLTDIKQSYVKINQNGQSQPILLLVVKVLRKTDALSWYTEGSLCVKLGTIDNLFYIQQGENLNDLHNWPKNQDFYLRDMFEIVCIYAKLFECKKIIVS